MITIGGMKIKKEVVMAKAYTKEEILERCKKKADKWGRVVSISHKMIFGIIVLLVILKLIAHNIFFQQNWSVILTMALFHLPNAISRIIKKEK